MSNTFGFFEKRGDGDVYKLTSVVTSPYETESISDTTMVRTLDKFSFGTLPVSFADDLLDSGHVNLFDFKADNTVALRSDLTLVDLVYEDDEADGIRAVRVTTSDNQKFDFSWFSTLGSHFRGVYPQGYTAP